MLNPERRRGTDASAHRGLQQREEGRCHENTAGRPRDPPMDRRRAHAITLESTRYRSELTKLA